jgi:hypothetical protein
MKGLEIKESSDELLRPFLTAAGEAESQSLLAGIISEHAEPIITGILKAKLRVSLSQQDGRHLNQDALEINSEVKATLLASLQSLKDHTQQKTINNFQNYVAVVTFNACYDYLRRKYPRRHSLKNRLRYLLAHRAHLAVWESADGDWLCGETNWRERRRDAEADRRLHAIAQDTQSFARARFPGTNPARLELDELLTIIFKELKGPAGLDELATVVARLQGIEEDRVEQETAAGDDETARDSAAASLPDLRANVVLQVDRKIYLEKLWSEICELPPKQRAAVLLNLKDAQGNSMVEMLPVTGIASVRQIAEALGIPAREFAALWQTLPLDDNAIASRLGITRQQVINLRKSARERLARRLRDY